MKEDEVYYISEHRRSYDNKDEFNNILHDKADFTIFPISVTRFDAHEARKILESEGYKINIIHQLFIKPFKFKNEWLNALNNSKYGGLVLDDDYEEGVASSLAHQLMIRTEKKVLTLGLKPRSAGFHTDVDNLSPTSEEIYKKIKDIITDE